jgi:hypothetical protein
MSGDHRVSEILNCSITCCYYLAIPPPPNHEVNESPRIMVAVADRLLHALQFQKKNGIFRYITNHVINANAYIHVRVAASITVSESPLWQHRWLLEGPPSQARN